MTKQPTKPFELNFEDQNKLVEQLIKKNKDATIKDYLTEKGDIEAEFKAVYLNAY